MNKAEAVLLQLIKASLFNIDTDFPDDVDWNAVMTEANEQKIIPLVIDCVPKSVKEVWLPYSTQIKAHFMRVLYEQKKALELLSSARIPCVILKGFAAAAYYPTPFERTMGDVDILIAENLFEQALQLFKSNDYKAVHDPIDGREAKLIHNDIAVELHLRYCDKEHDFEPLLQEGLKACQTFEIYGETFPILPKKENGLVLLDHIRHHLLGGLGLRQIIDFMMFVNSEPDTERFQREYLPVFEQNGLGTLVRAVTKVCVKYLGLPVSAAWCESVDDQTADQLLEYVLKCGNFGRKNPYEYRPISSFTMEVKKHGLFRTLQRAGVANCKVFQKHAVLRPFAWIYQSFRYFRKGIVALFKGEKLSEDVAEGKKKAEFFAKLGIN